MEFLDNFGTFGKISVRKSLILIATPLSTNIKIKLI